MNTNTRWGMVCRRIAVGACGVLLGLALFQGARLVEAGTCVVAWPGSDPTCCDNTDSQGDFSYTLHTQYYSQNKGDWTLALAMANPGGGILNSEQDPHQVSPTSVDIEEDDQTHTASGSFTTSCSGTLYNKAQGDKTSQCTAWDDDATPDCSGGRNVTIKAYQEDC